MSEFAGIRCDSESKAILTPTLCALMGSPTTMSINSFSGLRIVFIIISWPTSFPHSSISALTILLSIVPAREHLSKRLIIGINNM